MELNLEQRYWFAWLYGNTYNLATAWIIANEFPDYENVNIETLTKWNNENYKRLRYQTDNKWQKGHLPKMFESYRAAVGPNQREYFAKLTQQDMATNFKTVYTTVVKDFYKFGRYLTWFYLQTLYATCDLNICPDNLMLAEDSSRSHCKGLMYAVATEQWAEDKKFKLNNEQLQTLDLEAAIIIEDMRIEHPDVEPDYFSMETTLCAFKKIFRAEHGRYLGYYLDRQAEDIRQCERDGWHGINWDLLWQGRAENIAPELLNSCVNKNKFGELLKYGEISKINIMYDN